MTDQQPPDEPLFISSTDPSQWVWQMPENHASLALNVIDGEVLRFQRDGSVIVRGKPDATDAEIGAAMREWMAAMLKTRDGQ